MEAGSEAAGAVEVEAKVATEAVVAAAVEATEVLAVVLMFRTLSFGSRVVQTPPLLSQRRLHCPRTQASPFRP